MLSVGYMFVLQESVYGDTKETLSKHFSMDSVKNFIDLSKKVVKDGVVSLSEKEQSTYRGLFEDPAVKDYITAARKTGVRDGWLYGGILGGTAGGAIGSVAGGILGPAASAGTAASIASFITLGLLGAAAGGYALGWGLSKIISILRKWRAEDDVVKLGRSGGQVGKSGVIARVD
jgi:hypothetical protein